MNLKYVKPLILVDKTQSTRWHGLPKTVKMERCDDVLRVGYSSALGRLDTCVPEDEVVTLEKELGLKPGGLAPVRSNVYWQNKKVKLPGHTKAFNIDNPTERVEYYICLADSKVANSIAEYKQGKWPKAKYVIVDDETDARIDAESIKIEVEAFSRFQKMSPEEMSKFLKVAGISAKNTSMNVSYAKLGEFVKANPKEFLRLSGVDSKRLTATAKLVDYVQANLIRKKEKAYFYGDVQIGFDRESSVDFILNPENQGTVIQLEKNLENTQKLIK